MFLITVDLSPLTILTALLCSFSGHSLSVWVHGDQAGVVDSRWGLTYCLYSRIKTCMSQKWKDLPSLRQYCTGCSSRLSLSVQMYNVKLMRLICLLEVCRIRIWKPTKLTAKPHQEPKKSLVIHQDASWREVRTLHFSCARAGVGCSGHPIKLKCLIHFIYCVYYYVCRTRFFAVSVRKLICRLSWLCAFYHWYIYYSFL